jgi:hypothetical protein
MKAPDVQLAAAQLAAGGDALARLVADAGQSESTWRPGGRRWSLCEIFGHLIDEDTGDFRARLKLLLESPSNPWPPRDPEQNVRDGSFNQRTLDDLVRAFLKERKRSVAWVKTLHDANWAHAYAHPSAGKLTASALLYSWVAHDLLHVRQIVSVRYGWLERTAAPGKLDYAG